MGRSSKSFGDFVFAPCRIITSHLGHRVHPFDDFLGSRRMLVKNSYRWVADFSLRPKIRIPRHMPQIPSTRFGIINPMQPLIVGIRFTQIGKAYHFDASAIPQVKVGNHVIVETSRGKQLGEVTQIVQNPSSPPEGTWKPVERIATPRDLLLTTHVGAKRA